MVYKCNYCDAPFPVDSIRREHEAKYCQKNNPPPAAAERAAMAAGPPGTIASEEFECRMGCGGKFYTVNGRNRHHGYCFSSNRPKNDRHAAKPAPKSPPFVQPAFLQFPAALPSAAVPVNAQLPPMAPSERRPPTSASASASASGSGPILLCHLCEAGPFTPQLLECHKDHECPGKS